MVSYHDRWKKLCSYKNLELAFRRARKHKTLKPYVIEFEKELDNNLSLLQIELLLHCYRPKPLQTFIIRDPKTRKISKSHFRDRIVHHALCNVIEPLFTKSFIYDSYANRKGKGTLKAVKRFEFFARKVSHNYTRRVFVLKADVRHYFETVDHTILLSILTKKTADKRIRWLMKVILSNYHSAAHRLIKKKNMHHFYRKCDEKSAAYKEGKIQYDSIYDFMEGWIAYAKNANTFDVRKKILSEFEKRYPQEISRKEVNQHLNDEKKSRYIIIAEMKKRQVKFCSTSPTPTASPPPLLPPPLAP